jgi:hypothetical protein
LTSSLQSSPPSPALLRRGVSKLSICRGLEADSFHFIEDAAGSLFVCLNTFTEMSFQSGIKLSLVFDALTIETV